MLQVFRSYNGQKSNVKNSSAGPVALRKPMKLYSVKIDRSAIADHQSSEGNEQARSKLRDIQFMDNDGTQALTPNVAIGVQFEDVWIPLKHAEMTNLEKTKSTQQAVENRSHL